MIRLRVGNSHDTDLLSGTYNGVRMLWVNDAADVLMGINRAVAQGHSLALQCDRHAFASRHESFEFLGSRRLFPFTIYHLAAIYRLPVGFCFAVRERDCLRPIAPPVFRPSGTRSEVLAAGRIHFQQVLVVVERLLAERPFQWFNFDELNPAVAEEGATE